MGDALAARTTEERYNVRPADPPGRGGPSTRELPGRVLRTARRSDERVALVHVVHVDRNLRSRARLGVEPRERAARDVGWSSATTSGQMIVRPPAARRCSAIWQGRAFCPEGRWRPSAGSYLSGGGPAPGNYQCRVPGRARTYRGAATLMNMSAPAAAAGCPIARRRPTSSARGRQRVAACSASRHQDGRSAWPMTNQRPARDGLCIYRLRDGESTHLIDAHGTRDASQVPKGG